MPLFPEDHTIARGQNFTTSVVELLCWPRKRPHLPFILLLIGNFLNRGDQSRHSRFIEDLLLQIL